LGLINCKFINFVIKKKNPNALVLPVFPSNELELIELFILGIWSEIGYYFNVNEYPQLHPFNNKVVSARSSHNKWAATTILEIIKGVIPQTEGQEADGPAILAGNFWWFFCPNLVCLSRNFILNVEK